MKSATGEDFAGYKVTYVPKFPLSEAGLAGGMDENPQNAFFGSILSLLARGKFSSIDMNYRGLKSNSVEISLSVKGGGIGHHCSSELFESFGQLLPSDYGWCKFDCPSFDDDESFKHHFRLIREISCFDLHNVMSHKQEHGTTPSSTGDRQSDAAEHDISGTVPIRRFPFLHAPGVKVPRILEKATSFCVPILPSLLRSSDLYSLFESLQLCAPAAARVRIHCYRSSDHEGDQLLAANLDRHLNTMYVDRFADLALEDKASIRRTYDRYLLPSSHLFCVSLSIHAGDFQDGQKLAYVVGSTFGVPGKFMVMKSTRNSVRDPNPTWNWKDFFVERRIQEDPRYSGFMERLPFVYTKGEVLDLLRLPFVEGSIDLPGIESRLTRVFSVPRYLNSSSESTPYIRIGRAPDRVGGLTGEEHNNRWHSLSPVDLTKHTFIAGGTGSGKSTTCRFLLREIDRLKIPFHVVEPAKAEYYSHFTSAQFPKLNLRIRRFGFLNPTAVPPIDPLILREGVNILQQVSILSACFSSAFPIGKVEALILESGLLEYYSKECEFDAFRKGGFACIQFDGEGDNMTMKPSLDGFCSFFIETYIPQLNKEGPSGSTTSFLHDVAQYFKRRFTRLLNGYVGLMAKKEQKITLMMRKKGRKAGLDVFSEILADRDAHIIFELDAIMSNEEKALIISLILTALYNVRKTFRDPQAVDSAELKGVFLLEEAHRILANKTTVGQSNSDSAGQSAGSAAVELFTEMLAEIRAYGQGVVIVEQIPTKIVPEAIKLTNLRLMHRLTSSDDIAYMGSAMRFTDSQQEYVSTLKTGQFVAFEESLDSPVLLSTVPPDSWGTMWKSLIVAKSEPKSSPSSRPNGDPDHDVQEC